ncbi:arylsulfatase (plasmid) [Fulvitalea axinellae]|uniref:Arylsulfatase n=1 Tax=Fulvitalea axinellae TaxID=1182444 RepID=A0AAU9CUR6_9BACT|nr:arylsulfatase [Fulvitalea axinellae]
MISKRKMALALGVALEFFGIRNMPAYGQSEKQDRPNIVLLMADDMGYECLSAHGALDYKTPNIDRMMEDGIEFSHSYSQPLCTPSRVKIMTGRYNYRNYKDFGYLDVNEKTFGNVMKEAGYSTCIAGKWQLNGLKTGRENTLDDKRPQHFGFDEYCLWQLTKTKRQGERYASPLIEENGKVLPDTDGRYGPDIFSDYVVDFIRRKKDKPFFVYYPMVLVHDPFVPTPDSKDWADKNKRFKDRPEYFADMMAYTDKIVGKIRTALEREGVADNTIFIFTADNGTSIRINSRTKNGNIQGGKGQTLTKGHHVPMVAVWPKYKAKGKRYEGLIEFSDFLPTIAEAGGADIPENIDGKSFLPILKGRRHKDRETIFVHYDPMKRLKAPRKTGRFCRDLEYKLYHDGRFYFLPEDLQELSPLEDKDLDKKARKAKAKLAKELNKAPAWSPRKI